MEFDLSNPFFKFKNIVEGESAELLVYDEIWPYESYWWDMPNPQSFMKQLKDLANVKSITVRINSPGGDLFAAQAIYTQLRNHPASITTYVDGMAASAASLIAMAGDKRVMPINSMMMIHNPSSVAWGDYRAMETATEASRQARAALIAVYADRTNLTAEEIGIMLDRETWLTAQDALSMGFATEVDNFMQIAASLAGDKLMVNGRAFSFANFKTLPAAMLARGKEVTNDLSKPIKNEADQAGADTTVDTTSEAAATETGTELEEELATEVEETEAGDAITNAVKAERERISAIQNLARPGAEEIIKNAIETGKQPGDVALEILNSAEVRDAGTLNAMRADAPRVAPSAGSAPSQMSAKERKVSGLKAHLARIRGIDPDKI